MIIKLPQMLWLIPLFFCCYGTAAVQSDSPIVRVVLGTNIPAANSAVKTPSSLGQSADLVRCVFARLPYEVSMHVQPWRRVQQEVLTGVSDGFFTAMSDPQVDKYASLTDPLILEKWYWFSRAGTSVDVDPSSLRIGAILGSPQQLWYELNGHNTALGAQDLPQLIKLLFAGRVDVILADHKHFIEAANVLSIAPSRYQATFFRYVPLGVYMGQDFLASNSDFLSSFNKQIPFCAPDGFTLSSQEKTIIRQRIEPVVNRWLVSPTLAQVLAKYNLKRAGLTEPDIQQLDHHWRTAYQKTDIESLDQMLSSDLMRELTQWYDGDTSSYISEIIITGGRGMNVAAVPYSSDYWQGDELKFRHGIAQPAGQWFFDEVVFDSSSHRFQVQISLPLLLDATAAGVITLGVDVERVLHASEGDGKNFL
ncbi:substrate-binding periplasmic protein [Gilvimarinus polysaccharolyticus]|uniref:substrate-binding periplasmic protein n=1 Tax=Gilvimarinus polysaccharolyticus TaxID=863921 RepID=UPI0018DDF74D|nr:hypothetical protein [Gilvimarinus polysaccharolyticus]